MTGNFEHIDLARRAFLSVFNFGRSKNKSTLLYSAEDKFTDTSNSYWCHGAAGYAHSLLLAFEDEKISRKALNWAVNAFLKNCEDVPVGNITYCHGLAGRLELLRMLSKIKR